MTDIKADKFNYPRQEKLKSKKELAELFDKGKWKTNGSLRIVCHSSAEITHQKIGVSVSKRNFKKAVDRNRIKRLLREVYRLNKDVYTEAFGSNSISMLFWVSPERPGTYEEVEQNFLRLCASKK
ncbi:MAG: ribonuclease P protein component [Weeksellaceae bacterium]|nr:ribonuclease P protein component [Weeksellaceae bacterium]